MPLQSCFSAEWHSASGKAARTASYPPYFSSLQALDDYLANLPPDDRLGLDGIQKYVSNDQKVGQPRLQVCHDFKGGYSEDPFAIQYTFNWWFICDVFVYFSHNRVTIPPASWINAGHRQDTKVLGTLIFEWDVESEYAKLLHGPSAHPSTALSPHYARALAQLAARRGFDGYLLNFEASFKDEKEARMVSAWIVMLRAELRRTVGEHAEVIWYDSVTTSGKVVYQNALTDANFPFFLSADSLFTNYWWKTGGPLLSAQCLAEHLLLQNIIPGNTALARKIPTDIFQGIDVWGRGSLGGGGFGDFKALDVVKATTPAQSVALFGQGWTWEKTQELEGKAWTARGWWEYDRKLWVGTRRPGELTGSVSTPTELKDAVRLYPLLYGNGTKLSEADQIAIKPIQSYFPTRAPTDPVYIPFSTTFCPGVGYSWFAEGKKLMHLTEGWCDVDKQTSLGNLVWPGDDPDKPLAEISFEDAWSGGSSLLLSSKTSSMANWRSVPITDLTVSLDLAYSISIVWKVTSSTRNISVQPTVDSPSFSIITTDRGTKDVGSGWSRSTLDFTISSTPVPVPAPSDKPVAKVTLGLWAFATRDKALYPLTSAQETIAASPLSLLVGQVVVTPIDPNETIPDIVNTEWVPSNTAPVAGTLNGVLRWTIDYAFAATASQSSSSLIPWSFNQITDRLPSFAYFNIYISLESDLESKIFVGTTGVDGQGSEFFFRGIQVADISSKLSSPCVIHLLVQGVTDKGQATPLTGGVIVHIT